VKCAYLGKLKFLELQGLHNVIPKDIGGGKQPASATALLVCNRPGLEVNNVVEYMRVIDSRSTRSQRLTNISV
jgi:hypothetical protein